MPSVGATFTNGIAPSSRISSSIDPSGGSIGVWLAMPDKADVDASYRRLVYAHMKAGNYVNVATHDEASLVVSAG